MAEKKETTIIPHAQQQRGSRMTNSPDLREEDIRALLEATRGSSSTTTAVASPAPAPAPAPSAPAAQAAAPPPPPSGPTEAPSTNDATTNGVTNSLAAGSDTDNNKTNDTVPPVNGAQRVEKRSRDDTVKQSPQKRRKSSAAATKKAVDNDVRMTDAPPTQTSDTANATITSSTSTTTTTTTAQPSQQQETSNTHIEPPPTSNNIQPTPTIESSSQPPPAPTAPNDQSTIEDAPGELVAPESSGRPPPPPPIDTANGNNNNNNANPIPEGKDEMMAWLAKQVKAFGEQNRQDGDTSPQDGDNAEKSLEREKVREENRERKKRWRESNQARNKDNDLRCRVTKRANKLFGPGTSEKKSEWVAAEFEKRRKKREAKEASKRFDQNGNAIFSLNDGSNGSFDGNNGNGGFGGGAAGAAGQMLANALNMGEGATVDNLREALIGIGNSSGSGSGAGGNDGNIDLASFSELLTAMAEDENIMRAIADLLTANLSTDGTTAPAAGVAESTTEDQEVAQDVVVEPDVAQDIIQDVVAAAVQQEFPQEESVDVQEAAPEVAIDTEDGAPSTEALQEAIAHMQQVGLLPMDETAVEEGEQQLEGEQPVDEFAHDLPMEDGEGEGEEGDFSMLEDPNLLAELDVSPEMIAALQAATAAIAEKGLDINDFAALTANFPIHATSDNVGEDGEYGAVLEGQKEAMITEGAPEYADENLTQEPMETTEEFSGEHQPEEAAALQQEHLDELAAEVAEALEEDGDHKFSVEELLQQAMALQMPAEEQEEEQPEEEMEMEGEAEEGAEVHEEHDGEDANEVLARLVAGMDLEALAGLDLSSMGQDQIQALLTAVRALTGANAVDEGDAVEDEQLEDAAQFDGDTMAEDGSEHQHHQLEAEHEEHMIPELPGDIELLDDQHAEAGDASLGDILNSTADEVASADPTQHIAQAFLQALLQQVITSQSTAAAAAPSSASETTATATKASKSTTGSAAQTKSTAKPSKSKASTACTTSVFPADPKKTPGKRGRPRLPSPPPIPMLPPPDKFTFKPTKMISPLLVHGGIPRSSRIPDDTPIPPEVARLLKPPTFFPKPGVGNVVRSIIREKVNVEHDPRVKAMGFPPMLARLKPPTAV